MHDLKAGQSRDLLVVAVSRDAVELAKDRAQLLGCRLRRRTLAISLHGVTQLVQTEVGLPLIAGVKSKKLLIERPNAVLDYPTQIVPGELIELLLGGRASASLCDGS